MNTEDTPVSFQASFFVSINNIWYLQKPLIGGGSGDGRSLFWTRGLAWYSMSGNAAEFNLKSSEILVQGEEGGICVRSEGFFLLHSTRLIKNLFDAHVPALFKRLYNRK